MRGQFELTLSDGKKIPMRFCTWSLKRFCQLQGIGPSDIGEALSGKDSLDAIVNLLKSAAEYPLYSQGITPTFTEMEVCDWIDDMGDTYKKVYFTSPLMSDFRFTYTCGYATTPESMKTALLKMVGDLYEYRESSVESSKPSANLTTAYELMKPYKRVSIIF